MIPLLGFTPDLEPTTPGAITMCDNLIPYEAGMRAAPSPVNVGIDALPAVCQGAAVTRNLSGNTRLLAGDATDLYEVSGGAWSSVASGFTLSADDVWRFAAFGNSSLAVNAAVNMLRSTGGAFSAVSGAPKAKAIVSAKGFIMLLGTNEVTYGDSPDRWWCSAIFDETNWTPNLATQCATGRLVEGSGPLTAALRMGDTVVAYKERCVFVGQYVGGSVVWQWSPPIGDVGCVGVEAVADTPIGHVFVGSDNFYLFDGTRPVPIGDQVKQWWLDNSSAEYRYRTKLLWDRENSSVMVFYPSLSSVNGDCDAALVYHITARRWGVVTHSIEAVINYASQGITYDGGSPLVTDYNSGPAISFDSPFWLASKSSPGFFGVDHSIYTFTGIAGVSWFETGDYGDEEGHSMCPSLHIRCALQPSSMSCQGFTKTTSGANAVSAGSASFDGSKFPLRQTGRFHRYRIEMTGSAEFSAIRPKLIAAGNR